MGGVAYNLSAPGYTPPAPANVTGACSLGTGKQTRLNAKNPISCEDGI